MRGLYARALAHYGPHAQIDQMKEECAELIVELSHHRRFGTAMARRAVIGELADVQIMLAQMRILFGEADVDEVVREKEARLDRRMRGEA